MNQDQLDQWKWLNENFTIHKLSHRQLQDRCKEDDVLRRMSETTPVSPYYQYLEPKNKDFLPRLLTKKK